MFSFPDSLKQFDERPEHDYLEAKEGEGIKNLRDCYGG